MHISVFVACGETRVPFVAVLFLSPTQLCIVTDSTNCKRWHNAVKKLRLRTEKSFRVTDFVVTELTLMHVLCFIALLRDYTQIFIK